LVLQIGADPVLARAVRAGLHLPRWAGAAVLRPATDGLVTASAHDAHEVRSRRAFADAFFVSPVFPTQSHAREPALGVVGLSGLVRIAHRPVIALGGVTARNAWTLAGTSVAGLAAIGAFLG